MENETYFLFQIFLRDLIFFFFLKKYPFYSQKLPLINSINILIVNPQLTQLNLSMHTLHVYIPLDSTFVFNSQCAMWCDNRKKLTEL